MTTTEPTNNFSHWSDYWSTGALTSLPQDFAFNYDGEVAEFWQHRFADLDRGSCVLDICTGNAPIALLAAEWSAAQSADLSITAIDAAQPDSMQIARRGPQVAALLESIEIKGNTPVECLPFEDGQFDLVTSQYGLEYCSLDDAGPELARVLKPGGRLAVLAHAADTAIVETMAAESSDYASLRDSGLFKVLRSWEVGQLADPDLPRRLEPMLRRLASQAQRQGASPLLGQVVQSMAGLIQLPAAQRRQQRDAVGGFRRQLEAGQARLDDMLRVNRLVAENPDWDRPLAEAGLIRGEEGDLIYRGQHPMGHYVIWQKPVA